MTNKENALKVIRYIQDNVEGLKELSFGCKYGYFDYEGATLIEMSFTICKYVENGWVFGCDSSETPIEEIEIIGHEVQLNHLLLAIDFIRGARASVSTRGFVIGVDANIKSFDYDLTKTVQENLGSNPELCQYLINLFGL